MTKVINRRVPCTSCPFRANGSTAFYPETLDRTIGSNLREGYAHKCHQELGTPTERLCAGFVAFVRREGIPNRMVTFAERLGIMGPIGAADLIPGGWRAVLEAHASRLGVDVSAAGALVAGGDEDTEGLGGDDADAA